jgi:GNAT acetyltransferase-like protein
VSTLFGQPWWLEAVAPGAWGEAQVERDGAVVARLPWTVRRLPVRGIDLVRLGSPRLTPYLAPELHLGDGKPVTQLATEHKLLDGLIEQLPGFDYLSYTFAPSFTNWLPFYWHGCAGTLRTTYVLDDISDPDAVWRGMSDKTRNTIRKAERTLEVVVEPDASRLADAVSSTFGRHDRSTAFEPELLDRVHRAAVAHDAGVVLAAVDADGTSHASQMLVWDEERTYYLVGGSRSELLGSGAQSLLLWDGIKRAAERTPVFDFEGSMIEGVARFFRSFGSRPQSYLQVTAASRRMRLGLAARDVFRVLSPRGRSRG